MTEKDLPECFFEHDENGNRTSLSQLGTFFNRRALRVWRSRLFSR